MAAGDRRGGGAWAAFLVGALIIVVAVVGYVAWRSAHERRLDVALNVAPPSLSSVPSPSPAPDPQPLPAPLPRPPG